MGRLVSVLLLLGADAFENKFRQGCDAYEARDYATAGQCFEQLIQSSAASPVVFYNLGNAYYRQGLLGHAVVNYERALDLEPEFERAAESLAKVLRDTRRNLARPLGRSWEEDVLFWDDGLSYATVAVAAVLCWILFWLVLGLRHWRSFKYGRTFAVIALALAALCTLAAWSKTHPLPRAVAADETVAARYGKSKNDVVRFELYTGDRVRVDRREQGWARVATVDGERGWVRETQLVFVGPPYEAPAAR